MCGQYNEKNREVHFRVRMCNPFFSLIKRIKRMERRKRQKKLERGKT